MTTLTVLVVTGSIGRLGSKIVAALLDKGNVNVQFLDGSATGKGEAVDE